MVADSSQACQGQQKVYSRSYAGLGRFPFMLSLLRCMTRELPVACYLGSLRWCHVSRKSRRMLPIADGSWQSGAKLRATRSWSEH